MAGTKSCIRGALALLVLSVAGTVCAAPELVEVRDVLYKADGTRFEGMVFIEWKTFQGGDGTALPQNNVAVRVTYGNLRVRLAPTTNAVPAAYYRVRYNSNGSQAFTEFWAVPPATTILRLRDVRLSGAPTGGNNTTPPPVDTSVLIPDVSGLRDELDSRPSKGAGYAVSRAAVIGTTGDLEAATGAAGDCVRVDGTSGPCGQSIQFVDRETPSGVVDGANATLTLANAPSPAVSLQLFRNGVLLRQDIDYTLSGNTITFMSDATPQTGDILQAYYRR
ncbi:MAG TPA: hypothetical protein VE621_06660 [Bryobacteraceae bacterium]|nr:hypothetical protein [Bryobacteraceae bacterium]